MGESTELARRQEERLSILERVLGTGDMVQMIEATKRNVHAAIAFAREREFVTEYPIVRQGQQVGVRLWFHHPTWQLLGQSFGLTAYTEGEPKEIKPGTWQAAAVAATIETGQVVGRAVGICSRGEPGKSGGKGPPATDHTLAAIAQARAQRNALRSALGAVLIAAGFEISDPEGPATSQQVGLLHQLERELGWSHENGHEVAGVDSYKDLTREQAADLIDQWTLLRDEAQRRDAEGRASASPHAQAPSAGKSGADAEGGIAQAPGQETPGDKGPTLAYGEGAAAAPESPGAPPGNIDEAWARAPHDMSRVAALKLARKLHAEGRLPGDLPRTQAAMTAEQVAVVSNAYRDGERG